MAKNILKALFADGVNPIEGKNWRNWFPGKIALDAEVWTLTGGRGVALASVDDARPFVDTPFDTPDRVNVENVAQQTKTLVCLLDHIVNDTNAPGEIHQKRMPISEPSQFARMGLQGGFATVKGRVVRYDLKQSFIPGIPVGKSLAVITSTNIGITPACSTSGRRPRHATTRSARSRSASAGRWVAARPRSSWRCVRSCATRTHSASSPTTSSPKKTPSF